MGGGVLTAESDVRRTRREIAPTPWTPDDRGERSYDNRW
jgi:hypothetical protein